MSLSLVDKKNLNKVLKENAKENIYYESFDLKPSKYTNDDLIEFFVNLYEKKVTGTDKAHDNLIDKCIHSIFAVISNCIVNEIPIREETLSKAECLKTLYLDYVKNLNIESNPEILKSLEILNRCIVGNKVFNKSEVKEKEKNISDNDTKEIEDLKEQISLEKKSAQKKEETIVKLKKEKNKLEMKTNELTNKIITLEKSLYLKDNLLQATEEKLEKTLTNLKEVETEKDILKSTLVQKNIDIKSQSFIISEYDEKEKEIKRFKEIEKTIFKLLTEKSYSVLELKNELVNKYFDISIEEVQEILKEIKSKINVTNYSIPKKYKIEKAPFSVNNKLTFSNLEQKEIDILLVSDFHIEENEVNTYTRFDAIYNYCKKKNIKYIFNLGDLFDVKYKTSDAFENIEYINRNIELYLRKYPKDENIINAFLGGNHDKKMLIYGINPMETIADNRDDFVSLGYLDATISFAKDKIMLHHPEKKSIKSIKEAALDYLRKYYMDNNLDRNEYYIDLLGHYHKSYLSQSEGYFLLPSYIYNIDSESGATHLKIYFDDNYNIIDMSFIPLINRGKLISAGEIDYKKLIKK